MMLRLWLGLVAAGSGLWGCSCVPGAERRPACEAFFQAQTVFVGTVIDQNDNGSRQFDQPVAYLVRVDEAFRGLQEGEKEVFIDPGSFTSCLTRFQMGEQYLFYGYGKGTAIGGRAQGLSARWAGKKEFRIFGSGQCSPTRPVKMAGEDVTWLRNRSDEEQTRIFGVALQQSWLGFGWGMNDADVPPAGARVVLTGTNGELTTTTAADGSYSFAGVAPGDYRIFAEKAGWTGSRTENVRLFGGGCARNALTLQSHGEAQGVLRDATGRPAAGVRVELVRVLPDGHLAGMVSHWSETDENGRFRFRNVAAGTFVMGVNLRSAPTHREPYAATYYPGVARAELAKRLTFGPNTLLENLVLQLPTAIGRRAVRVNVIGADGKPVTAVARASASHRGRSAAFENVRTGNVVELPLLEGLEYEITGSWVGRVDGRSVFAESEPVRLPAGRDPVTIDVRLGQPR